MPGAVSIQSISALWAMVSINSLLMGEISCGSGMVLILDIVGHS
jgi:uncharacterized membrane protein